MSFDLFNLMPAVDRIRDIAIAESQQLLTPAELAELATLKAGDAAALSRRSIPAGRAHSQGAARSAALSAAGYAGATRRAGRRSGSVLRRPVHRDLRAVGYPVYRRSDRLPVGEGNCAGGRRSACRGRRDDFAAPPQRHRAGDGAACTRYDRMGRARRRVLPGAGRHAVHEPPTAVEPLRAGPAQLARPGLDIETGFDRTSHKVDVRRIASRRGRYNVQNIGIFLWSLGAYSLTSDEAAISAASPECLRFNSLGMDIPLFHRAISQGEKIDDPAQPFNVADRLRRRVLCNDLQKGRGRVVLRRRQEPRGVLRRRAAQPVRNRGGEPFRRGRVVGEHAGRGQPLSRGARS